MKAWEAFSTPCPWNTAEKFSILCTISVRKDLGIQNGPRLRSLPYPIFGDGEAFQGNNVDFPRLQLLQGKSKWSTRTFWQWRFVWLSSLWRASCKLGKKCLD